MLTCNTSELSVVKITSLQPGDLFAYAGSDGRFTGVVVENEEGQYLSWMRLTGDHSFLMEELGQGPRAYGHAHKVLNLSLRWDTLQVQIDQTSITRTTNAPIGSLVVDDDAQIASDFMPSNEGGENEFFGVALRNLERRSLPTSSAYVCPKWRLIHVSPGLPPEVIAEFSPAEAASVEPLRI
jgi:hypothetical protein